MGLKLDKTFDEINNSINWANTERQVKTYVALLSQSGTNAPVATVLENSLGGTIVWSRNNIGAYRAYLASGFQDENKIFITVTPKSDDLQVVDFWFAEYLSLNNFGTPFTMMTDGFECYLEIKVYP